jgi:hypothetical protein
VESELVTTDDVAGESARVYELLQTIVDTQLLNPGFVPPTDYGIEEGFVSPDNNRCVNSPLRPAGSVSWRCTNKQRELIENLVVEHQLNKNEVDLLSRQRFGKGVRDLNKVEASGLIDELFDTNGGQKHPATNGPRSVYAGVNGNGGGR